jgi:two-component sensor histidine kinase
MPTHHIWNVDQLRSAINAAGVGLWAWNVDSDEIALDDRACDLWGQAKDSHVTFEKLSARIYPADLDKVKNSFLATRPSLGTFEIDFRIILNTELRWISARGQGNDKDLAMRLMFGVFLDVSQRKQAEENQELLAGEMSHRVKNLLAIASVLAVISSKSTKTKEDMVSDFSQRLIDLGRTHDLVRPTAQGDARSALLGDLFSVLLSPYNNAEKSEQQRFHVSLPRLSIGENTITALALVIHELATNSLKYGALSSAHGTLDVSAAPHAIGEDLVIIWTERGGPAITDPPVLSGFGSNLVARTVSGQLEGSITYDWAKEGVTVKLQVNASCLAA